MTYPSVVSTGTSQEASSVNTFDLVLPAVVNSGELLLAFASIDDGSGNEIVWDNATAGTWTLAGSHYRSTSITGIVMKKIADGTEDGASLSIIVNSGDGGNAQRGVMRSYAIDNWDGDLNNVTVATSDQNAANADCPLLTVGWGALDTLWIAYTANDATVVVSSYPNSFTLNQHTQSAGAGPGTGDGIAMATYAGSDTLDPPAFENPSTASVMFTVAVKPVGDPRALTIDSETFAPGATDIPVTLAGHGGAIDSFDLNGVLETDINSSTATGFYFDAPPLSDFLQGAAHEQSNWYTTYTITDNEGGQTATDSFQFTTPDSDGPTYWYQQYTLAPSSDSLHPDASSGDWLFFEVTSGTLGSISGAGAPAWSTANGEGQARIWNVSSGGWSAINSTEFISASVPDDMYAEVYFDGGALTVKDITPHNMYSEVYFDNQWTEGVSNPDEMYSEVYMDGAVLTLVVSSSMIDIDTGRIRFRG